MLCMQGGLSGEVDGPDEGHVLSQVAIYRCLLDIAGGMDYLHSLGVLHGARPL
jgi:hypothetical protein